MDQQRTILKIGLSSSSSCVLLRGNTNAGATDISPMCTFAAAPATTEMIMMVIILEIMLKMMMTMMMVGNTAGS